jgi:hypothetical protein
MGLADYEQALQAARSWIAKHGRYPQQQEWEYQASGRPTTRTIKRRWGWEQLMRAAAGDGRLGPEGDTRKARRRELLCVLRRAREEMGRWPHRWRVGVRHPGACLSALLHARVRQLAPSLPDGGSLEAMSLTLLVKVG